jgi:hypothetical protein
MRLDSKESYRAAAERLLGRQDVGGLTAAFARALEHRIAKVYAAEFAQYRAHEFFPTSTEVDPGALSFTYRMIERIGNAGVIATSGQSRDLPQADIGGTETQAPVITLGISYGFSVIDEKSSSMAGIAIETEKAKAAREAIEALEEQIWAIGYSSAGVAGVTTAPGVYVLPQLSISSGTWATQIASIATATTSNATPPAVVVAQAIAADLASMKQAVNIGTLGNQRATNCLLPTNLYEFLDYVPRSPGFTDDTLLQWLEKITGLDIDEWNILQNAGSLNGSALSLAGGTAQKTRVVVYDKDPDVVQLMVAQSFTQLAPQLAGLMYEIPCFSRLGGAMAVRPRGIVAMDGCIHNNVTADDTDAFYDGASVSAVGSAPCKTELDSVMSRAY